MALVASIYDITSLVDLHDGMRTQGILHRTESQLKWNLFELCRFNFVNIKF